MTPPSTPLVVWCVDEVEEDDTRRCDGDNAYDSSKEQWTWNPINEFGGTCEISEDGAHITLTNVNLEKAADPPAPFNYKIWRLRGDITNDGDVPVDVIFAYIFRLPYHTEDLPSISVRTSIHRGLLPGRTLSDDSPFSQYDFTVVPHIDPTVVIGYSASQYVKPRDSSEGGFYGRDKSKHLWTTLLGETPEGFSWTASDARTYATVDWGIFDGPDGHLRGINVWHFYPNDLIIAEQGVIALRCDPRVAQKPYNVHDSDGDWETGKVAWACHPNSILGWGA